MNTRKPIKIGETKKIKKIMKKLDNQYMKSEGRPLTRARIVKKATQLQERLDFIHEVMNNE